MTFAEIVGTPLRVRVCAAGESVDLASADGGALLRAMELPGALVRELEEGMSTPLDEAFHRAWREQRDATRERAAQTIREVAPGAYDLRIVVPERGSLHARAAERQLELDYRVGRVHGQYRVSASKAQAKRDPAVTFAFDGRLRIRVAVPEDPCVPLAVRLAFQTENTTGTLAPGFGNLMRGALFGLRMAVSGQAIEVPTDQRIELAGSDAPELVARFGQMSRGFAAAGAAGFSTLEPMVFDEGRGATVGFRLSRA